MASLVDPVDRIKGIEPEVPDMTQQVAARILRDRNAEMASYAVISPRRNLTAPGSNWQSSEYREAPSPNQGLAYLLKVWALLRIISYHHLPTSSSCMTGASSRA